MPTHDENRIGDFQDEIRSLRRELALADGVCRELRYLIAKDGTAKGLKCDTIIPLMERWLETSTSKFKYERPAFIKAN